MSTRRHRSAALVALAALVGSGLAAAPAVGAQPAEVPHETSTVASEVEVGASAVEPRIASGPFFTITSKATGASGVDVVARGRQSLIHITDVRARQRFLFDVDLPEGASLRATGAGLVAQAEDGTTLAGLTPPWAKDAKGVDVATRFEVVDSDTFAQVIEHRVVADYPVIADPWWVIPVAIRVGGRILARQVTRASTREAAMRIAKRQIARQLNYQIEDLLANSGLQLRKLNSRNFRENVRRRVGWSKAALKPYDAHHTLPKKFETFFNRAGLNIHNPVFGHPWCRRSHQSYAGRFNSDWESFRDKYADRVRDDATSRRVIEDYRLDIISKYSSRYQCANRRESWSAMVVPGSSGR